MTYRYPIERVCCPSHPNAELVEDYRAGDTICPECGLVVGDRVIDVGMEWRAINNALGGNDFLFCNGIIDDSLSEGQTLTTRIGPNTKTATYIKRTTAKKTSINSLAFMELSCIAEKISLSDVIIKQGCFLLKDIYDAKLLRKHSKAVIFSTCLYIACRKENVPRTFKEISAASGVSTKEIRRCFSLIPQNLKQSRNGVKFISTEDFIPRFCSNLRVSYSIQKDACYIAQKARTLNLVCARSPVSVAATAIFAAVQNSTNKYSVKEIGKISGVAEATILTIYKNISHLLTRSDSIEHVQT